MELLLIDDDPERKNIIQEYFPSTEGYNITQTISFSDFNHHLQKHLYDLVILDLNDSGVDGTNTSGLSILDQIWRTDFIPVIINSAYTDLYITGPHNDLIIPVKKGISEEDELKSAISLFQPYIAQKNAIIDTVRMHINQTYKTIHPLLAPSQLTQDHNLLEVYARLMKRRIGASFDESTQDKKLFSWEMYLYPAIPKTALTCDIIQKCDTESNDPNSFYIILSPSCDIQPSRAKIENVIVASFVKIEKYIKSEAQLTPRNNSKCIENLEKHINSSTVKRFIPFPGLHGILPEMACDLKNILSVPYCEIIDETKYIRKVSIDSPFRESITWAFMQVNCRPGLPDRDNAQWASDLLKTYES